MFYPRLKKKCWKMLGETSVFCFSRVNIQQITTVKDRCPLPLSKKCPPQKSKPMISHNCETGVGASWTLAHLLVAWQHRDLGKGSVFLSRVGMALWQY